MFRPASALALAPAEDDALAEEAGEARELRGRRVVDHLLERNVGLGLYRVAGLANQGSTCYLNALLQVRRLAS